MAEYSQCNFLYFFCFRCAICRRIFLNSYSHPHKHPHKSYWNLIHVGIELSDETYVLHVNFA